MPSITLPFPREHFRIDPRKKARNLERLSAFSPELQSIAKKRWYVRAYLQALPLDEIGTPFYASKLSREMRDLKVKNVIYPGNDGFLVHIYPDPVDERDYYIPIEPSLVVDVDEKIQRIEPKLLDWAQSIGEAPEEKRRVVFLQALNHICTTHVGTDNGQIHVSPLQLQGLRYRLVRDKLQLGLLQPLLADPYIEDISCSGIGSIFIEHSIFKSLKSSITFPTMDDLDRYVVWLGERIKRPVTVRHPIVDSVLPDGSRINIVYGRDIAKRGSNFTIRKFSEEPLSVLKLIEYGTLSYEMAAYLWLALEEGLNIFVAGATASGKTTTMNAITTFIKPDAKIVSIEDTPELQVPHENWIREVIREGGRAERHASVEMFDLLKAALRQRPDRIIIGEIRGVEGNTAFQAMQTGHGVMSTFHAASVQKLIQRITGDPINVPKPYVENLDIILIQAAVRGPDGRMVRRVTSINEIVAYDPTDSTYSFITAFRWKPEDDTFEFPGEMNSYLLEEDIAMRRGLAEADRRKIYGELRRRARILESLHTRAGVTGFAHLFAALGEGRKVGVI
jgi:archaeal flagellar protein FlaI